MGKSRMELRRMTEAAEAQEKASPKATKKKATRKKAATRRVREKPPERKRAVWVLYSSSMKEEGRYPYDQKEAADARLAVLQARGKRLYFMQMVKELITDGSGPVIPIEPVVNDEELNEAPTAAKPDAATGEAESDELADVEVDEADFDDDDDDEEEEEEAGDDEE